MSEIGAWFRLMESLGGTAVFGLILYKLIDKWAAKFLEAQQAQTAAMTSQAGAIAELVRTVREGQGDQHEVLLAVRVMGRQLEQMKEKADGRDR